MSHELKRYRLRSIIDRVIDYRGLTPAKLGYDWQEDKQGIPAVSALNIKNNCLVKQSEMKYVSGVLYEAWMREKVIAGDLLLTSEAPLGEMYIVKDGDKLCLSQRVFGLRTKKELVNTKYLHYCLASSQGQFRLYRRSSGTTAKGIRASELMQVEVDLPSMNVQRKKAKYLDDKNQSLDKILTAKKHTQTRLSELRQAIIVDSVRTGTTITSAPKVRLKSIAKIYNGATPKSDNNEFWDGNISWATPVDLSKLNDKFIKSTQRLITQAGYMSCNTPLVKPGNIIISNRAPIGLVGINHIPLCINQGCKALVLDKSKIDVKFLYYVLCSMTDDLKNLGTGTTFMEISSDSLKNIEIPLPLLEEQQKIAQRLSAKIMELDGVNSKLTNSIELLEEYRSSLISRVAGGKVDV